MKQEIGGYIYYSTKKEAQDKFLDFVELNLVWIRLQEMLGKALNVLVETEKEKIKWRNK